VYDINNPSVSKKYLNIGKANGYAFWGEYLLIFHDSSITKLSRGRILNQSNPIEDVIEMGESVSAAVLHDDFIYYASGKTLKKYNINTNEISILTQLTVSADKAFITRTAPFCICCPAVRTAGPSMFLTTEPVH
jgi:hypothetical protein